MLRKGKLYLFLILFVGMAFVAILGKWVSCFLPSNLIQNNIRNSVAILREEGLVIPPLYSGRVSYDNATDAQVLSVIYSSVNKNEPVLMRAFANEQISWEETTNPITWLEKLVNYDFEGGVKSIYVVRHWMGITVPLKVLLCFFDYGSIRTMLMVAIFLLLINLATKIYQIDKKLALSFVISFIAIDVGNICLTVNSWAISMISLGAVYGIIYFRKKN